MFKRSFRSQEAAGSHRDHPHRHGVDKSAKIKKRDRDAQQQQQQQKLAKLQRSFAAEEALPRKNLAPSPIITVTVGREGRLFAAHEDILCQSSFFRTAVEGLYANNSHSKRISLPAETPEIFSAVLEYLYKGDYYPRLLHSKHRNSWELEDSNGAPGAFNLPTPHTSPNLVPPTPPYSDYNSPAATNNYNNSPRTQHGAPGSGHGGPVGNSPRAASVEATVYLPDEGGALLRDTAIYCAADRYGLEELKCLSLRKQGLQGGIDVATIIRSAKYAYAHTPDSDSRLRAHYLALIIRCRKTFKRSGTMQTEMERGGSKLFFDLFVAMCNHLDDVVEATGGRTPRTV